MLTVELLRQNKALSELSDEVLNAISELSKNDEAQTVAAKVRETENSIATQMKEAFGIEGVTDLDLKTAIEFGKTKLSKSDTSAFEKQINDLKEELKAEKAKKGGDRDTDKINQLTAELNDTKQKFAELNKKLSEKEKEFNGKLNDYKITSYISSAMQGMKFKKDISEPVLNVVKQQAVNLLKTQFSPTLQGDEGSESLIFMKDGVPYNNPANSLKPFTASELLSQQFEQFGVLDKGRQAGGAGSSGGGQGNGSLLDLSGCKTKVEANKVAQEYLAKKGYTSESEEYQTELDKIWVENKIADLPTE